jgi:hypothetical protein
VVVLTSPLPHHPHLTPVRRPFSLVDYYSIPSHNLFTDSVSSRLFIYSLIIFRDLPIPRIMHTSNFIFPIFHLNHLTLFNLFLFFINLVLAPHAVLFLYCYPHIKHSLCFFFFGFLCYTIVLFISLSTILLVYFILSFFFCFPKHKQQSFLQYDLRNSCFYAVLRNEITMW